MRPSENVDLPESRSNLTREDLEFHRGQVDRCGYTVIANVLTAAQLETARGLLDQVYASYDPEIDGRKRVDGYRYSANVVNKGLFFESLIAMPEVFALVQNVLGRDCILSSFNTLEPLKDQGDQRLHRDVVHPPGERVESVNCWWAVDNMGPDNGATRVVPGSHRNENPPAEMEGRAIQLAAPAGHVVVIDTRLVHGASNNPTGRRRRVMHLHYVRRGQPQQTDQKRYLSADVQARIPANLRRILALD